MDDGDGPAQAIKPFAGAAAASAAVVVDLVGDGFVFFLLNTRCFFLGGPP